MDAGVGARGVLRRLYNQFLEEAGVTGASKEVVPESESGASPPPGIMRGGIVYLAPTDLDQHHTHGQTENHDRTTISTRS